MTAPFSDFDPWPEVPLARYGRDKGGTYPAARYSSDGGTRRWMEMLRRDPCSYCGRTDQPITFDHITPTRKAIYNAEVNSTRPTPAMPDPWGWSNLTAACWSCNANKRRLSVLTFMSRSPWTLPARKPFGRRRA